MFKVNDPKERRLELRRRLQNGPLIAAPGCGDALGARLIEQAGFDAVYISGFAVEAAFGQPDIGLLGMSEVATRAAEIVRSVNLPVICDGDAGYGSIGNVIRTVQFFEQAGVSAIQLEDQSAPKKCGAMQGKQLVSKAEMVARIRAAVEARNDPNLLIIARTDAVPVEGFDAAMDRMSAYEEAGADMSMVLGPYGEEQLRTLVDASKLPFAFLNSEALTMPLLPLEQLERIGVGMVVFPISLLLTAVHAMQATLHEIRRTGTTLPLVESSMIGFREFNELIGLGAAREWDERYNPGVFS
ncbi:MAG: isocitrate lyase/PEP mutase family protein [Burkholderiaceae bacterium]